MLANPANAFNMGNMANPSKWMGSDNDSDRYDDYRGGPGYGNAGGPAYGAPGAGSNDAEIMPLKERHRRLEGGVR